MNLQHLGTRLEIKAADEGTGEIEGYGSVFDVEDSYGDIVEKGAFKATIASGRMPKMLWQHNDAQPMGVWTEMAEDDRGLRLRGTVNTETQLGRDAFALIRQGAIDGLSIGFRIPKGGAEWDEETGIRRVKNIDLWEVSLVTFPAMHLATLDGFKSLEDIDELDVRGLERFLREAGLSRDGAKRFLHRHGQIVLEREAEATRASELEQRTARLLAALGSS